MTNCDRLSSELLKAQQRIFRLANRDHGMSLKNIGSDANIHYDTLRAYASGHTAMPMLAFLKLVDVLPDYLLSQLIAPVGRTIVPTESDDGDLDALGCEAAAFTAEYVDAKRDGKISPIEHARLKERADRLSGTAERVKAA